jgi:beta-mannosidase
MLHKRSLLLLVSVLLSVKNFSQSSISQVLTAQWKFKQVGKEQWFKATVPGTVHTDLMANHIIDDPFYRDNEKKIQWISKEDWEYESSFNIDAKTLSKKTVELVFDGLDTYADVYINNHLVLQADNMFRTWHVNAKPFLQPKNNQLRLVFHSAESKADSLAKAALPLVRPCENNRHYVRKAQYNFWWDWAPTMITCGIWRNIHINAFDTHPAEEPVQNPYKRYNIQLVQEKDSIGQSFYFTVNGKPTFMKGANWVPADVFLPRITHEKYRNLLVAAKEAGFNLLRVWGGGIYEDDYFYHLCDSLHIYVWQEFMFAGAMYPADNAFLENVKQEAIDNIKRLRKHPCIIVWCGNNEIDEAWHHWGWQKGVSSKDSTQLWNDYKKLFQELLPDLVAKYDGRPYISSSPKYGYGDKKSLSYGDSHYWGVWVMGEPIETYKTKVPRFMSEYGMQAMPNWETIEQFSLPADWDTTSSTMRVHQKHIRGYQNLALYLNQNNMHPTTFKDFVDATQELQSKALETAITAHINAQPRCMGTMFWQLNDCWPVASWSVIDYYGRKKKAYYTVKKLYNQK